MLGKSGGRGADHSHFRRTMATTVGTSTRWRKNGACPLANYEALVAPINDDDKRNGHSSALAMAEWMLASRESAVNGLDK